MKHQFLSSAELSGLFEIGQRRQLTFGDARLSADRRSDVDSEGTANQQGGLDAR
jgi:hypothetical protein